jgi:hypothetical protein
VRGADFLGAVSRARVPTNLATWEVYRRAAERDPAHRDLVRAMRRAFLLRRLRERVKPIVRPFRGRVVGRGR